MTPRAALLLALLIVSMFAYAGAATATTWSPGDETTFNQATWGDPTTPAAIILATNFNTVYSSTFGTLEVGIPGLAGFSILFSDATAVIGYLPQLGPIGPLNADLVDPTTSSSGAFGGEVVALRLNVDYSDVGVLPIASGVAFGNLVLANFSSLPQLNGLTVREFLGDVVAA